MRASETIPSVIPITLLLLSAIPHPNIALANGKELLPRFPQGIGGGLPPGFNPPAPDPPSFPPAPIRPSPPNQQETPPPPENITEVRCRAQELSQGSALRILIVLAVGCAVQLPGSTTFLGHKGLYRLAPELCIVESASLIALVTLGVFWHRYSFRTSVRAALALRHFLGEQERWWRWLEYEDQQPTTPPPDGDERDSPLERHPPATETDAFQNLDPFLAPLRSFSHSRLLGLGLTTLAFAKACAVTGAVSTAVLAGTYYFSFITIDALAWTLFEPGPPRSRDQLEREAVECAWLMDKLDPFRDSDPSSNYSSIPLHLRYTAQIDQQGTRFGFPKLFQGKSVSLVASILLVWVFTPLMGISVLIHIFWPISVPLFILLDFTYKSTGKWEFVYLTWVPWLFWFLVAVGTVVAVAAIADKFFNIIDTSMLWSLGRDWLGRWTKNWVGFYAAAKTFLIIHYYLINYTGEGTRKPGWLDWLG